MENLQRSPRQCEEYLAMGFELMPSGRVNEHKWYKQKFGRGSVKDTTWSRENHWHSCCMSKRAYRHKLGCKNRKELLADDDYSDLKDVV